MLTGEDTRTIEDWARLRPDLVEITLHADNGETGRRLSEFCDQLLRCAPQIAVDRKPLKPADGMPAIGIGDRLLYHAVPLGPELPVFLACLDDPVAGAGVSPEIRGALSAVSLPTRLTVFISSRCPFCPEMVRRLAALTAITPGARLFIVDAALFPAQAARYEIQSVPAVILDDQLRWTGGVSLSELADGIVHRDPARLSATSLRGIIEDGKASQIAQMMASADALFPAIFELLIDEKWPIRLGAMVTLETLAAEAPLLARRAEEKIMALLSASSDTVQGDLLYLLGEIGDASLVAHLQPYQSEAFPESVREAASDAIDAIRAREQEGA